MNIKVFFTLVILLASSLLLNAQIKDQSEKYKLLIGSSNKDAGISVYDFNDLDGRLSFKSRVTAVANPTFLTISRDRKFLYSVSKGINEEDGIAAFNFDSFSGELTLLNRKSSGGKGPSYVSVDDKNKYVFVSNYIGGSLSAIPIMKDGTLGSDIQTFQYEGSSIDKIRQDKPYIHCTVLSPDNRYLFAIDLGTDKIYIYRFDATKKSYPLIPVEPAFITVKAGSGPRHLTFHPNGKFAYLIQEMGGLITMFDYYEGKLIARQTITMIPEDYKGEIRAADIHISPDGKFLYGSNRGNANEIVIYAIDEKGNLSYRGRQSTLGKSPRSFAIDPTGDYLSVANQVSNDIFIFRRNKENGLLTPIGERIEVAAPAFLKFVSSPISEAISGGLFTLKVNNTSITIDSDVAARVTSLKLEDKEFLSLKSGNEKNYGSTLWLSPQGKWNGSKAILDDSAYRVVSLNDSSLYLESEKDTLSGFSFSKQFNGHSADTSILIRYTITNISKDIKEVAPWEVTRVPTGGLAFFPKSTHPPLPKSNLIIQDSINMIWYSYDSSIEYSRQKLFMNGSEGWMAYVQDGMVFIKQFPDILPIEVAPGEEEVEIFSNKEKPFIELENQGPYQRLLPKELLTYEVKWYIRNLPKSIDPEVGSKALIEYVRSVIR